MVALSALLLLFACTEKTYITNPPPVIPDQRPPQVEWVSVNSRADLNPPYYAVHDTVTLTISAADESGVDSVKHYVNGFPRFFTPPPPPPRKRGGKDRLPHRLRGGRRGVFSFLWNTLSDSDGVYSLEARAWDKAGNAGETPTLLVRVSNTSPPPEDRCRPTCGGNRPPEAPLSLIQCD